MKKNLLLIVSLLLFLFGNTQTAGGYILLKPDRSCIVSLPLYEKHVKCRVNLQSFNLMYYK